jgi:hypothetical protein
VKRLLSFILLLAMGCTGPNSETFVMGLDNITPPEPAVKNVLEVPESLKASDGLKIRVSVAGGGCIRFSHFETKRTDARLEVTPIGSRPLNATCTADYRTWWVEYLDAATPRSNPFTVIVHRANGADLERSVTVTP